MDIKKTLMGRDSLPIRKFDFNWMVPNPSICLIAKRGSGKSWLVKDLLNYFRNIPGGVIIAPTDRMSSFYKKFFPDLYIFYEYDSNHIANILYRQEEMIEKCKYKAKKKKKVDPRALLIMDDCLATKGTWMKEPSMINILQNGRHYKLTYILTMQYSLGIKPELRSNFDYVFLLADDFQSNQKRLYDHYAGMFPNFNSFRDVFIKLTQNYGAMVIANRGAKANILDKVFWYKAKKVDIDRIGCKQFNKYNKWNYDEKWRTKNRQFDIQKYIEDKKSSQLNVEKIYNDD